jgi:integrase
MPKSLAKSRKPAKPAKPRLDWPLFPHATRRWAKKIKGRLHYFGPWDNPDAALQKYLDEKDDLYAGRVPRSKVDGLELRDLVNKFLTFKLGLVQTGELQQVTFSEYHNICALMLDHFGKHRLATDITSADFAGLRSELARGVGLVGLGKRIQVVRSVFKYGYDTALLDRPARFGPEFKKPSRKSLRRARAGEPAKMYTAAEINALLKNASLPLKAMILLGINAALGNSDCSELNQTALDLNGGWLRFPRPKTGVDRRCPLWPETVAAIRAALAGRPKPKNPEDDAAVFLTKFGERWVRFRTSERSKNGCWTNSVGLEFGKRADELKLAERGTGFYGLRHTFRTVADAVHDRGAIDLIMGHADDGNDMRSHYVEHVDDDRLRRVTDHVYAWLFPPKQKAKRTQTVEKPRAKGKGDQGARGLRLVRPDVA